MNASAVHPLHSSRATGPRDSLLGTRVMQIATGPRPACGLRSMQAGGLAAQSVNVLLGVCLPPSRLLPDPLQREEQRVPGLHAACEACRRAGSPLSRSTYCWEYASLLRGSSLTHCNEKSNGSPSRATAGYPLL